MDPALVAIGTTFVTNLLQANAAHLAGQYLKGSRASNLSLKDLPYEEIITDQMSVSRAIRLGVVSAGSAEASDGQQLFIQEYAKYKMVYSNTGEDKSLGAIRLGVSVRWITQIEKLDRQAKITFSLPWLCAKAQMNEIKARSEFKVIGASSATITGLMPTSRELNVETYADLAAALSKIKAVLWSDKTSISPVPLAATADYNPSQDVS